MLGVNKLVEEVSVYLNDFEPNYEFTRWKESSLRYYLSLACKTLMALDKSLFAHEQIVRLKDGNLQELPKGSGDLLDIIAYTTKKGDVIGTMREVSGDYKMLPAWCTNGRYPKSWSHAAGYNQFYVYPNGLKSDYVKVLTAKLPDTRFDTLDLDAGLEPVLFELILSYALGSEQDNEKWQALSNAHYEKGMNLLGIYAGKGITNAQRRAK